jgi:hypothetical protein
MDCPLPELTVIEGCEGCAMYQWYINETEYTDMDKTYAFRPYCMVMMLSAQKPCPFKGMTVKFPEGK